ncbi:hypothetical protein [Calothrix sp. UHCC 0171]|uniref:hypothetical protein n=1 Tax=Calothrix sp. UHCC 0171 TaxID=3110245 RepID=UPI002B20AB84|nr:hypothetical protein [Calothrix sp. UHCC 0171]MEA5571960.1 hypothetical protein [Calothrix sp. UHCC 0171]
MQKRETLAQLIRRTVLEFEQWQAEQQIQASIESSQPQTKPKRRRHKANYTNSPKENNR